ncbi:MAG: hypothetical protein JO316_11555 [Abitibacteriaceae bacterium]|nr:hypothetical protein [Abditibacteriaceae bacterium]
MNIPNPAGSIAEALRAFYTVDNTLKRVEEDIRSMKNEMSAIREEHSDLKSRVAVLEESRKTVEAQMRAIVAETVADLRVKFAES